MPAWLLLISGLRFWPSPRTDRYSRIARHGLLIAIAVLATGSSFEAVGAIGYEEMLGIPLLAGFHPVGVVIGATGLALAFSAVGVNLLVWGAARAGKSKAGWMPYAMGLAGFGGIAFMLGGLIFGYWFRLPGVFGALWRRQRRRRRSPAPATINIALSLRQTCRSST